jgi:hypothetical protein
LSGLTAAEEEGSAKETDVWKVGEVEAIDRMAAEREHDLGKGHTVQKPERKMEHHHRLR